MRIALALALLALPLTASASLRQYRPAFSVEGAASAAGCPRVEPSHVDNTQGYADGFRSGKCYVVIGVRSTTTMIYRGYSFFSDGLLMVFSSYGEGEDPGLTSAREFFFFPRRGALALEMDEAAGTVSVVMSDGGRAHVDPATAQLKSLARGSVAVSPRVDPAERGGVEITSYAGLMLDAGFLVGESPSGRPNADSTFRDAQGHLCTVKNSEVFAYANGEHELKFTDARLSAWLKTRCPNLTPGF